MGKVVMSWALMASLRVCTTADMLRFVRGGSKKAKTMAKPSPDYRVIVSVDTEASFTSRYRRQIRHVTVRYSAAFREERIGKPPRPSLWKQSTSFCRCDVPFTDLSCVCQLLRSAHRPSCERCRAKISTATRVLLHEKDGRAEGSRACNVWHNVRCS